MKKTACDRLRCCQRIAASRLLAQINTYLQRPGEAADGQAFRLQGWPAGPTQYAAGGQKHRVLRLLQSAGSSLGREL